MSIIIVNPYLNLSRSVLLYNWGVSIVTHTCSSLVCAYEDSSNLSGVTYLCFFSFTIYLLFRRFFYKSYEKNGPTIRCYRSVHQNRNKFHKTSIVYTIHCYTWTLRSPIFFFFDLIRIAHLRLLLLIICNRWQYSCNMWHNMLSVMV